MFKALLNECSALLIVYRALSNARSALFEDVHGSFECM